MSQNRKYEYNLLVVLPPKQNPTISPLYGYAIHTEQACSTPTFLLTPTSSATFPRVLFKFYITKHLHLQKHK